MIITKDSHFIKFLGNLFQFLFLVTQSILVFVEFSFKYKKTILFEQLFSMEKQQFVCIQCANII